MNTVLNIVNRKQNLSYPLIFSKIAKYYWTRDIICKEYKQNNSNESFQQLLRVNIPTVEKWCAKNKYTRMFDKLRLDLLIPIAIKLNDANLLETILQKNKTRPVDPIFLKIACHCNCICNKHNDLIQILLKYSEKHTGIINYCKSIDTLKILLEHKVDINENNSKILFNLLKNENPNLEFLKFLCENKCNINSSNKEQLTPLTCAVIKNNLEAVKILLDYGAVTINNKIISKSVCNREILDLLCKKGLLYIRRSERLAKMKKI